MKLFLFLLFGLISNLEGSNVFIWQNLEDFYEFGWYPTFSSEENPNFYEYGQGVSYPRPSSLNPNLLLLDEGISGNGVWSGREVDGGKFSFTLPLNKTGTCEGRITSMNITIKYYYAPSSENETAELVATPCSGDTGWDCKSVGNIPLEWKSFTFPVYLYVGRVRIEVHKTGIALIDEVRLIHNGINCAERITTSRPDPDFCDESCEYKAISCHDYYSCVNSTKQYFTCEKEDGLAFNPVLGVCDKMENVEGCQPKPCVCEYRPHLGNCSNYYFCPDTCKEELCELRSCPSGLLWSLEENEEGNIIQQCQIAEKAICITENY